MIEIGWIDILRKPLIVVMKQGNIHDHGMIHEIAAYTVPTIEEAVDLAVKILIP